MERKKLEDKNIPISVSLPFSVLTLIDERTEKRSRFILNCIIDKFATNYESISREDLIELLAEKEKQIEAIKAALKPKEEKLKRELDFENWLMNLSAEQRNKFAEEASKERISSSEYLIQKFKEQAEHVTV